jgi:hypothetical protein
MGTTGIIIGAGGWIGTTPIPIGFAGAAPTPVNCKQTSSSSATDSCQIELSCDNDQIFTSCYAQSAGIWSCSCSGMYTGQAYQVNGGTSATTCAALADVCRTGKQPATTGAKLCTPQLDSSGSGYCEYMAQCSSSSEVAPGITAQIQDSKYVTCSTNGGQNRCDCSTNFGVKSYQLSSAITSSSCRTIATLCDQEVEFSAAPTCTPSSQYVSTGTCNLAQECTTTAAVSDGVTALRTESQSGQCQDLKNGNASCSCYGNQKSIQFDLPSATTTIRTCVAAQAVCNSTDELQLADPVKCEATYQSASTQSCNAQMTCSQSATQGTQQLVVYGSLYVGCQPNAVGSTWSCSCSSGTNTTTVTVDGTSSWAVCTTATQLCPAQVKVDMLNSSGGIAVPPGGILPL